MAALAVHHDQPRPPIDVIEAQRGDLTGPQAQTEEDEQDGIVPTAITPSPVTGVQKLARISGCDSCR